MRNAILFRCHASDAYGTLVTVLNLVTLAAGNRGVPIHVLHGGLTSRCERLLGWFARRLCASYSRSSEMPPIPVLNRPYWWAHGDLAIVEWFQREGHRHQFDRVYVHDWDMVLGEPASNVLDRVPAGALGLTWLQTFEQLAARKWDWIVAPSLRPQAEQLVAWVRSTYGYAGTLYGCFFTGTVLPRVFIEEYAQQPDLPAISCAEVRLPLVASALGFQLANSDFIPIDEEDDLLNLDEPSVPRLIRYLWRTPQHRLFHPVRTIGVALVLLTTTLARRPTPLVGVLTEREAT